MGGVVFNKAGYERQLAGSYGRTAYEPPLPYGFTKGRGFILANNTPDAIRRVNNGMFDGSPNDVVKAYLRAYGSWLDNRSGFSIFNRMVPSSFSDDVISRIPKQHIDYLANVLAKHSVKNNRRIFKGTGLVKPLSVNVRHRDLVGKSFIDDYNKEFNSQM